MNQLDKEYKLTDEEYGMGDFIDDLKDKGYIDENRQTGSITITPKTEQGIRKRSLEEIFGKLKKTKQGNHNTFKPGGGDEINPETRPFQFGDQLEQIDFTESIRNAQINHGIEQFSMQEDDLEIRETDFKAQTSTVLMIDISHSMILYGEDRFTPAKKVALALAHLIRSQYPGDSLKIVLFHDDAEELPIAKLATTQVGPYHTNTAEGLKLARRLLAAQRHDMKQIVMITDGKPTACFIDPSNAAGLGLRGRSVNPEAGRRLYQNSMGNDPFVMGQTFKEVQACRRSGIMINTFMLASDPYLVDFVKKMSGMTNGKAYFANPDNLTEFVLMDFLKRRTSRVK
jgi:uncharacterized protein with von Willebrand factor type A (vWA) domain